MTGPALSVVIPAYNQARFLRHSLEALRNQTLPADLYEVIVVDDGSTDETAVVAAAEEAASRQIRLVRHERNRGRSAARNSGVRAARGDLVVLLDGDVLVRPDFLAYHLDTHRRSGRPVLCRGPVLDIPDERIPDPLPIVPPSPAYLTTANASLPREELLAAGLFDEAFPAYGWEDFDLGFRLQRRGLRRVFRREAIAFHVLPIFDAAGFADALRKEEDRARTAVYLYRKHPHWQTTLLIQGTRAHRVFYFLLAGAGLLHPGNAVAIATSLRRRGLISLSYLVLRNCLNWHYIQALGREQARAAGDGAHG